MYHSYNQHSNMEAELLSKFPVDSRVPDNYGLTQFMPDVTRKDFADDTMTVEPMKNDREVNDSIEKQYHIYTGLSLLCSRSIISNAIP